MVQIACLATTFLRTRWWGNPLCLFPNPVQPQFLLDSVGSDPACTGNAPSSEPHHLLSFSVMHNKRYGYTKMMGWGTICTQKN